MWELLNRAPAVGWHFLPPSPSPVRIVTMEFTEESVCRSEPSFASAQSPSISSPEDLHISCAWLRRSCHLCLSLSELQRRYSKNRRRRDTRLWIYVWTGVSIRGGGWGQLSLYNSSACLGFSNALMVGESASGRCSQSLSRMWFLDGELRYSGQCRGIWLAHAGTGRI
jgi:hypothetical protein